MNSYTSRPNSIYILGGRSIYRNGSQQDDFTALEIVGNARDSLEVRHTAKHVQGSSVYNKELFAQNVYTNSVEKLWSRISQTNNK